jgi:hypothetical protein
MARKSLASATGLTHPIRDGAASRAEHPVFGGQIFVPQQQLLVHRPRDVGQNAPQFIRPPASRSAMGPPQKT